MAWTQWLGAHWFDLTQTLGIIAGFYYAAASLRHEAKTQRAAITFSLTSQHRDLWLELITRPELSRILDPATDVHTKPATTQETLFVNLLILHLDSAYRAIKVGMFGEPKGLGADIAGLFSLPLPRTVWDRTRDLRDPDFVQFVEKRLTMGKAHPAAD